MSVVEENTTEAVVDAFDPPAPVKDVTIGQGEYEQSYTLRPLGFFQKLELLGVLGKALDEAMSGDNPISISELTDVPVRGENLSAQDFADADMFIRSIAKLAQHAPDLVQEVYCIALGVPRGRRDMVKQIMALPEDQGGLSDDVGFGILETFINQNAEVLVDFFTQRLLPLLDRTMAATKSASPTPSSPSPVSTESQ